MSLSVMLWVMGPERRLLLFGTHIVRKASEWDALVATRHARRFVETVQWSIRILRGGIASVGFRDVHDRWVPVFVTGIVGGAT